MQPNLAGLDGAAASALRCFIVLATAVALAVGVGLRLGGL